MSKWPGNAQLVEEEIFVSHVFQSAHMSSIIPSPRIPDTRFIGGPLPPISALCQAPDDGVPHGVGAVIQLGHRIHAEAVPLTLIALDQLTAQNVSPS